MSIFANVETTSHDIASKALINEYKGNLFEYLVAQGLAQAVGKEATFLSSFGGEAKERLVFYQQELLRLDPALYKQLPQFARVVTGRLLEKIEFKEKVENILVLGKSAGAHHDESYGECDLMVLGSGKSKWPVSLKFCKRGAYVNTKSGGIRSFIQKYFASFPDAQSKQEKMNEALELSFEHMARDLYACRGLDYSQSEKPFDDYWDGPHLPGELNEEEKKILLRHYYQMIHELFQTLKLFFKDDREQLITCLYPLVGLTDRDLLQATCFHHGDQSEVHLFTKEEMTKNIDNFTLKDLKDQVSSFEISFGRRLLQIRVKPMNKFTVSALKINCSVKTL